MSEAPVTEKPADAPEEKPFNTDVLQQCTARMTHQAWGVYLNMKTDLTAIQTVPVRAALKARSKDGAQAIAGLLKEAGVTLITAKDLRLEFTATFAQIQTVIKHPQTHLLDVVKL
jgi:hypothetical protein